MNAEQRTLQYREFIESYLSNIYGDRDKHPRKRYLKQWNKVFWLEESVFVRFSPLISAVCAAEIGRMPHLLRLLWK